MTCMFTTQVFFFCTAPSLWLNCLRIRRQWRTSSCPAAALRRQRQRHRYSPPLHTDLRASFQIQRGLTRRSVQESIIISRRGNFASKQHCVTHIQWESGNNRNAISRNITEVLPPQPSSSRGDTSEGVVCDKLTETNQSWAWAELRMWHGAICSDDLGVGNVLRGIRRGGDRSLLFCYEMCVCFSLSPRWCGA